MDGVALGHRGSASASPAGREALGWRRSRRPGRERAAGRASGAFPRRLDPLVLAAASGRDLQEGEALGHIGPCSITKTQPETRTAIIRPGFPDRLHDHGDSEGAFAVSRTRGSGMRAADSKDRVPYRRLFRHPWPPEAPNFCTGYARRPGIMRFNPARPGTNRTDPNR
jgi:hypothetical protein